MNAPVKNLRTTTAMLLVCQNVSIPKYALIPREKLLAVSPASGLDFLLRYLSCCVILFRDCMPKLVAKLRLCRGLVWGAAYEFWRSICDQKVDCQSEKH